MISRTRRFRQGSFIIVLLTAILFISCKKEKTSPSQNEILSYALENNSYTDLYKAEKKIIVSIDDRVDRKSLTPFFQLSKGAVATVNGLPQRSSAMLDLTNPVTYTVTGQDGAVANWQVSLQSNTAMVGLGKEITDEKYNDPNPFYEWYINQDSTKNGGFSCLAMAMYWSDPQYHYDPTDIYKEIKDGSGVLHTNLLTDYLSSRGIPWKMIALPDRELTIKHIIDKGYILILCADLRHIPYDFAQEHRVERFYPVSNPGGHFFIIKGYRETDEKNFWFEVYDPLNKGISYKNNGGPKGKNRYYHSEYIQDATNKWWDYAIVIGKHYRFLDKLDTEVDPKSAYVSSGY